MNSMDSIMSENNKEQEVTHLFWTGGWDSTFRLLQLLLDEKKTVQPHYIITAQPSVDKELETMSAIRNELFRTYPYTRDLLKPMMYEKEKDIKPNKEISEYYRKFKEKKQLRWQYEMLARYCDQLSEGKIELCILEGSMFEIAEDPSEDGLSSENMGKETLFNNYFTYPLVKISENGKYFSKKEMASLSNKKEWDDIMYMTWFCRVPKNGKPCGFCGPCTDILIHNMGRRLPLKARLIAKIQLPFRKWWRNNYKLQSKGLFKLVRKVLDRRI